VSNAPAALPRWVDFVVLPLLNLLLAFIVSGLVVVAIGENPFDALQSLVDGAVGSEEGIGYTLYYATDMVFVGLAVAMAFIADCSTSAATARPISPDWASRWSACISTPCPSG